ncbi:MAG: rod-binding protein [Defluviicoccus sp.]|nr:rod-binding protein [Defluviicoccus sp.]MDG4591097.1 rod-binding protein [Defluviicoccus sp.]MDS4011413.1 rod-binding protein [Defluviicoccus sp.]MDS4071633.1 rod-binding protein [Defluviicoccus sp.]
MTDPLTEPALPVAAVAAPRLPRVSAATDAAAMRRVAQEFEAVFLAQMLKPMFADAEAEAPFGGGPAEEIWRSVQLDEIGKSIARSGGIGLASAIERELVRLQAETEDAGR